MDKNNSYLIISIILGFLITLFYIHQFDIVFLGNFILISFIIYILFYFLGNKEAVTKEMFQNTENNEEIDFEEGKDYKEQKFYLYVLNNGNKEYLTRDESTDKIILGNDTSKALLFDIQFSKDKKYYHVLNAPPHQVIHFSEEIEFAVSTPDKIYDQLLPHGGSNTIEENNEKIGSYYIYPDNSELKEIYKEFLSSERLEEEVDYEEQETHIFDEEEAIPHMQESEYMDEDTMKEETFAEQMEEQEEHIRQAQEMEELQEEMKHQMEEEEEMRDHIHKKTKEKGVLDKIMENINNIKTGINSGIGLGISPVNINLSCGGNNGPPSEKENSHAPPKPNTPKKCISGNSSRIYNNSDWIYNNPYWKNQDESYNYNGNEESQKLEPCTKDSNSDDYLLPCIQPEANKIPQTLNNLMNSKKPTHGEVCPLEVNMPWSNYKTGDDKESNNIIEGYNF